MGGASSNQYSRVTNAVMIEAAAAITSNNDSAATIVFFDLLLSRPDHSAAASGSTPTLKLRIATAACNCSKSSNGNPAISATVSAWGERVRCTDFALVISNRGCVLARRIQMIEHQVNDHSGHRDVQPHRKCPPSDAPVNHKLSRQGPFQRDDHKRHDGHRQYRVRSKNREVQRPHPAFAGESSDPRSESDVINKIRDQKETRSDDRGNHARAMSCNAFAANHNEPDDDQDSSRRVEHRV